MPRFRGSRGPRGAPICELLALRLFVASTEGVGRDEGKREGAACDGGAHARAKGLTREGRDDGGHETTSEATMENGGSPFIAFPENEVRVAAD